jgi:hypothetical protein
MQFYKIHIFSDLRDNAYIMFTPVRQPNTTDYFDNPAENPHGTEPILHLKPYSNYHESYVTITWPHRSRGVQIPAPGWRATKFCRMGPYIFSINTVVCPLKRKNVHHFNVPSRKRQDNNEVHRSLYNCGSTVQHLLHVTLMEFRI